MEQRNIEQKEKTLVTCSTILKHPDNWAPRGAGGKNIELKKLNTPIE